MQLEKLHETADELHIIHGHPDLKPIYGAGCVKNPDFMFIFMNPTARNISSSPDWKGLRAPWLGTKDVWRLFYELGFLDKKIYDSVQNFKTGQWTEKFCKEIYQNIAKHKIYITNLAKCTQKDARPLKSPVFKKYLDLTLREITEIKPKKILTLGNMVSSVLLGKSISVKDHVGKCKLLQMGRKKYPIYPIYYPVGQGRRNLALAIKTIDNIASGLYKQKGGKGH